MLQKTRSSYSALSKTGKVLLWAGTAIVGGGVITAAANPAPQSQPTKPETLQSQSEAKKPSIETKTETETEAVAFTKTTVEDGNLAKGTTKITTAGVNGVKTKTYTVTYEDGQQKEKKLVSEAVTTPPITEVTAIGTYVAYVAPQPEPQSNCDPNYTPCVPNVSYDLDCPDIGFSVTVIGYDKHGFDGNDNDGQGCESY